MSDGSNAAKGLPGYKKTLTTGYYAELFNAPPAAPPTAGEPWTGPGYANRPRISDPPTPPPPPPDRMLRSLSTCGSCGATFGFSPNPDRAVCPRCDEGSRIATPTYSPGTQWF